MAAALTDLDRLHERAEQRHGSDGCPEIGTYLEVAAEMWPPRGAELPPEDVVEWFFAHDACAFCCDEVRRGRCGCCECDSACSCDQSGGICRCGGQLCQSCQERREMTQ